MGRPGESKPEDSYSVLGVRQDATAKEIASAYRNLALRYHPDKNPSSEAAQRFEAISQAYAVLMDANARRALDAVISSHRALEEREAALDGLRKSMRDDLLRREQAARKRKLEEESAQAKLCQELDRLRRKAEAQAQRERKEPPKPVFDDRDKTLKISLKRRVDEGGFSLTSDTLRDLLALRGEISDIVISPKRTTSLVVFKDVLNAKSVMSCFERGDFDESGLEATWAKGHPPTMPNLPDDLEGAKLPKRDVESLTLMRMRQHAERARLRSQLAADPDVFKDTKDQGLK